MSGLPGGVDAPRLMVTGASGMLGSAICIAALAAGYRIAAVTRKGPGFAWDIAHGAPAPTSLREWQPDAVIHAAAFTDVDAAEQVDSPARATNVDGTARVAAFADSVGARLLYCSTDGVFDGVAGGYSAHDAPHPLNVYAQTKLEGEAIVAQLPRALTVRFNIVGPGRLTWWILQSLQSRSAIEVFSDVVFNPLDVRELAPRLITLAFSELIGVRHLGSDKAMSKAEFAELLAQASGLSSTGVLRHVRLADRQTNVQRPLNTSLVPSSDAVAVTGGVPSLSVAIHRLAAEFTSVGAT